MQRRAQAGLFHRAALVVLMLAGTLFSPTLLRAQRGENFKFPVFYEKTSPEQTNRNLPYVGAAS